MSRSLSRFEKRSLPRFMLSDVGLASKNARSVSFCLCAPKTAPMAEREFDRLREGDSPRSLSTSSLSTSVSREVPC
jgi:hypothetical protein